MRSDGERRWLSVRSCIVVVRAGRSATDYFVQPVDFCLRPLLFPLASLLTILNAFEEPSEVALMLACSFVLSPLELSIFDVGTAVLAPVFRLLCQISATARIWGRGVQECSLP